MFKIGDKVFKGVYERTEKWITCPDCLGTRRVKVVLGDGTEVSIECGGCYPGRYEPPLGVIRQYEFSTRVRSYTVTGVNMRADRVEYELDNFGGSYFTGREDDTFGTEEKAMAFAEEKRKEHEEEENKRWLAKTRDTKSWAWNAAYHRKCIKDLERQLEYHRAKAQICAGNSKKAA